MSRRHWQQMPMAKWYVIGFYADRHELILLASEGEHFWRLENEDNKRVGKATHIPLDGINEAKRWAENVIDGVITGFVEPLDVDDCVSKVAEAEEEKIWLSEALIIAMIKKAVARDHLLSPSDRAPILKWLQSKKDELS